jgi:hypothetical protein
MQISRELPSPKIRELARILLFVFVSTTPLAKTALGRINREIGTPLASLGGAKFAQRKRMVFDLKITVFDG